MSNKQSKALVAPFLPDAVNGELKRSDLSTGKIIIPIYDFMSIGDKVTLHIVGEPGDPQAPVTFPEIIDVTTVAYIEHPINPESHLNYWQTLDVYYAVKTKDGSDKGVSEKVRVTIV